MRKSLLVVLLFLILSGCKKSDQKLNSLIFGTWETDQPFKDRFMGGFFGDIDNRDKYVFHRPNYCDTYFYDDNYGFQLSRDSLTFHIGDEEIYLYDNQGSLVTNFTILKLGENNLKLKFRDDEVMKFDKRK